MAAFIGETVLVTLKDPSHAQVRGRVTDIVNQQLTLKDGKPRSFFFSAWLVFLADEYSGLGRLRPTVRHLSDQRA